ncbi:reverse transcriptase [Senna tora]|uniref:Reverse transcriptase n=1 Tax=Senna tora TaxID=362788 RepID=A0A834SED5_9FABA|nr:reverse transcriptase [Senna tora]
MGMKLIELDPEELLSPMTEPEPPALNSAPAPPDNSDPELEILIEKYCYAPVSIQHPFPRIRLNNNPFESNCNDKGFKWVEFLTGEFGLTNAVVVVESEAVPHNLLNLSDEQIFALMEDPQQRDILEINDFLRCVKMTHQHRDIEFGESSSARGPPMETEHQFEVEETMIGVIQQVGAQNSEQQVSPPSSTLMDVVMGYSAQQQDELENSNEKLSKNTAITGAKDMLNMAQRAKKLWLLNEDRTTKYFHTLVNNRRSFCRIQTVQDGAGTWFKDHVEINQHAVQFFTNIFSSNDTITIEETRQRLRDVGVPWL